MRLILTSTRCARYYLFTLLACFGTFGSAKAEIVVSTTTQIHGLSGTGESSSGSDSNNVSLDLTGNELSLIPCGRKFGRNSVASGLAKAKIRKVRSESATVYLSVSALANGGHYRSCGTCALDLCIDIRGNDTNATATANSQATFEFDLENARIADGDEYVLSVLTAIDKKNLPSVKMNIVGAKSTTLASTNGLSRFLVEPTAHGVFRLDVEMEASASNEGGCCQQKNEQSSFITVGIQRAALLESKMARLGPRMINGELESGFPSVGLVELRDRIDKTLWSAHCSGILLTRTHVLTAAHCTHDIDASNELRFMLGPSSDSKLSSRYPVKSAEYPKGRKSDFGLEYSSDGYIDDIAVLRLRNSVDQDVTPLKLHRGSPDLADLKEKNSKLFFIGFGAYESGLGRSGAGLKRRLELGIKKLELRRFSNEVKDGKNTCGGDSGAPAFADAGSGELLIAGVVSKGDKNCLLTGHNSRIDYYAKWIRAHTQ